MNRVCIETLVLMKPVCKMEIYSPTHREMMRGQERGKRKASLYLTSNGSRSATGRALSVVRQNQKPRLTEPASNFYRIGMNFYRIGMKNYLPHSGFIDSI